ncbi:MAG: TlpA disulfide reductase family protein [Rikenellaceae bacterium]
MKKLFLMGFAVLALHSCSNSPKHNLTVEVDGWGNDIVIACTNDQKIDTLQAVNGVVTLDFDTTQLYNVVALTRLEDLFRGTMRLESKAINVIGFKDEYLEIKGQLQDGILNYSIPQFEDFEALHQKTLPFDIAADSLNVLIEIGFSKGDRTINHLFEEREEEYNKIREAHLDYIQNNPDSELSAYLAAQLNNIIFKQGYNLLSDSLKSGKYKPLLDTKLEAALKYEAFQESKRSGAIAVDKPAPDFTLPSLEGKEISLSDFKGKWVILDFWGSWCGWCIRGVPNMKEFYDKYSKTVEIIGIACGDTDQDWRAAVKEHKLNWTNLFNDKGVSSKYAVRGYPTKILVSPDGVIKHIQNGEAESYYNEIKKIIGL